MYQSTGRIYNLQFILLCLSNALFSASFNMMIPELPAYLTRMGGADYKGYIIGLFTLMAGLSRPFSGKLSDTIGRVPVMIFGSLVCVVCSLTYPLISSVGAFLLLRFFHGFSTGFKPTGTSAYVSDLVPVTRRGEAMGMVGLFSTIGMAMGPAIGGYVAMRWNINIMFQLSALFSLLSVVILVGMKETLANKQRFRLALLKISGDEIFEPLVWSPVIITFLTYFSYGAVLTVIPDFGAYLGISNKGLFYTFFTGSSIGIRLLAGKVSDKYGRVPVLKISAVLMAISMLMLGLAGNSTLLLAAAVVYGISVGLNAPAVTAWTVDLGRPEHRGRALATMYIAMEAGIGLGAYFSAFIYSNQSANFPLTFYVMAGITLAAALYLSFGYKPAQKQPC
ncbi:putative MFS family arabinose efflux permease [Chitinophaga polysaccharea]|uniref:Putative MFS family arabinose efflux permease n=1 Tax=Chitinophaga polysaccharea TaxID=1293035 RepID=A0A561Q2P1_9BACT|nr:MFS transporter [Chitinophaga polysaccharea]TWF44636.1 putative MFS family arabinose efflux permease [Chitinophaga polysaccharea]